MKHLRSALFCATASLAAFHLLPFSPARDAAAEPAAAEAAAMLGASAPATRASSLSQMLRAGDQPVFAVMRSAGTPAAPRYEASGITLVVATLRYPKITIENARLVLSPSPDGRSCRFEIAGAPFGATSRLAASGNVEWAAGPNGGDRLTLDFALDDASVDLVRTLLPDRVDPSFAGLLDLHAKGDGVVGEVSSEDGPATPLRGSYELALDWTILGRTSPARATGEFSLDDRSVRIRSGRLAWQDLAIDTRGWFDPMPGGKFELTGIFQNVDAQRVTTAWNVPPAWRPAATLSGELLFSGTPGKSMLRYEASAPSVDVPSMGGWPVRVTNPKMKGSLLAINAEVSVSIVPDGLRVGGIDFGPMPGGIQWFRRHLMFNTANTTLWGGKHDGTVSYKPDEHPAFSISGKLTSAVAKDVAAALVPWMGLDVDGSSSLTYVFGQDRERKPRWTVHASLTSGRLGGADLFAQLFDALAAVDPGLKTAEVAAMLPQPRKGIGTRVDKLFFELVPSGDAWDLGSVVMSGGGLQLECDGSFSRASGLRLQGTMALPVEMTDRIVSATPWATALRTGEAPIFVPVVVSGQPSALKIELAPGYAELVAKAKRGEAVEAPRMHEVRHVGEKEMATIPGDPSFIPLE